MQEVHEILEDQQETEDEKEAVKVQGTAQSSKSCVEERAIVEKPREEYFVEKILAKKWQINKNLYLVKWKGFEQDRTCTGEP